MSHRADSTGQDSGRYAVRLAGHLHPRWAPRFDGMTLIHLDDGTTLLEGDLRDQAALHDVIRTLRDLGLPLVSLIRLEDSDSRTDPATDTSPESGTSSTRPDVPLAATTMRSARAVLGLSALHARAGSRRPP